MWLNSVQIDIDAVAKVVNHMIGAEERFEGGDGATEVAMFTVSVGHAKLVEHLADMPVLYLIIRR